MSCGFKATCVGAPDPLLQQTDLVQSFTEALTTEENIRQIGKERLAMSSKSITPSSAGWGLHCSRRSSQLNGTYSFTLLEKSFLQEKQQAAQPRLIQLQGEARPAGQRSGSENVSQNQERRGLISISESNRFELCSLSSFFTQSLPACLNAHVCYMKYQACKVAIVFNHNKLLLLILYRPF